MITLTTKGIAIDIPGLYDVDDIEILQEELNDALQIASASKEKASNYYRLFLLLKAIGPNREQLEQLYPASKH